MIELQDEPGTAGTHETVEFDATVLASETDENYESEDWSMEDREGLRDGEEEGENDEEEGEEEGEDWPEDDVDNEDDDETYDGAEDDTDDWEDGEWGEGAEDDAAGSIFSRLNEDRSRMIMALSIIVAILILSTAYYTFVIDHDEEMKIIIID